MATFEDLPFAAEGRYIEWGRLAACKAQEMLDWLEELEDAIEDIIPS